MKKLMWGAAAILLCAVLLAAQQLPLSGPTSVMGVSDGTGNMRPLLGDSSGRFIASTIDPCQSSGVAKSSAFANITTATTTALVAVSGTTTVYVCGFTINMVATVAEDTVILEQGTGAACASSPVSLTPTYQSGILGATANSTNIVYGGAGQTILKTAASNGLCAVTTVGTGPIIGILVTFVQQ